MSRIPVMRARRRVRRRRRSAFLIPIACSLALALVVGLYVLFLPKEVEKSAYPLSYRDLIERYAGEYSLDPARVAAVIFCESSFRADAVSSAGALGLMQIMPDTGGWIAKKLDRADSYAQSDLFDPETNIAFGCWYLHYLNERFDGDITKVTAAYHAGGTTVSNWLKDTLYSADGVTLTNMPESATKAYVENVLNTYEKYKEIL